MSNEEVNDRLEDGDPNVIRARVENVEDLTEDGVTFEKRIDGFPWMLNVYRRGDGDIRLRLDCEEKTRECAVWECEVEGEVKLINQVDDSHSVCKKFDSSVRFDSNWVDLGRGRKFKDVIGDENFVVDGNILIEVKMVVKGGNGDRFRKRRQTDFFSPSKYSDVILSVEGEKLHVSKQILAHASSYFDVLFYGNFKKSSENEFLIEGFSFEEFLTVLELIYDTGKELNEKNVESVICVADHYQFTSLTIRAEEVLKSSDIPFHKIFLLADRFNLYDLKAVCLSAWDEDLTSEKREKVINSKSYNLFSNDLKNDLSEWKKIMEEAEKMDDYWMKREERDMWSDKKNSDLWEWSDKRLEKLKTDFSCPSNFSDVIFVVEGKKIHASKQILAHASSYFEILFYGDVEKLNEKEFIIEDVSYKEFYMAIVMIYDPRSENIEESDTEVLIILDNLLKIADRFNITRLTDWTEVELNGFDTPAHLLLRLADKYKLEVFMNGIMNWTRWECSDIVKIVDSESYKHYSSELKITLFEKMTKLWKIANR